jgi:hypothetical protein
MRDKVRQKDQGLSPYLTKGEGENRHKFNTDGGKPQTGIGLPAD